MLIVSFICYCLLLKSFADRVLNKYVMFGIQFDQNK